MSGFGRNAGLAAYHSVAVHGGVVDADPHTLVQMLFDAAVERMTTARGCIERGEQARKARLLHSCVSIVAELRGSLDLKNGGPLARNLHELYGYVARQLLIANVRSDDRCLADALSLIEEIRSAWVAIGPQVRASASPAVSSKLGLASPG